MSRYLEIAFAFPRGSPQEVFIEGILEYSQQNHRRWSFMIAPEANSVSISQLVGWPGDGVIAALNSPAEAKVAESFPIPVVNISSALDVSPVPRTMVDNYAIGKLAARHFLERAYDNLGFYGLKSIAYSQRRYEGFRDSLEKYGIQVTSHLAAPTFKLRGNAWLSQQAELTAWLKTIELPIGILAVSDARARQLLNSCQQLGLQVPNQVAVLGVDDQQIICEHFHPTISSIARNSVQEGYEAARILDSLLEERELPENDLLVAPAAVIPRESTETVAVQDERLRDVLVYIREHVEHSTSVEELCSYVDVSRRWLENAFRKNLGESPSNYMRRHRLRHAKRLLREERRTAINSIARRSGYASANQLAKAFRAEFGQTPRDYRKSLTRR